MLNFDFVEKVRKAGVVGAGGAGFPTFVKVRQDINTLIANGAECEPLISKDKELMRTFAPEIIKGLELTGKAVSAKEIVIGIKEKNQAEISALKNNSGYRIKYCLMKDVYPAGDEFVLVYEATGKLIPPAGIPIEIGCLVLNVETLYNIGRAVDGMPVTDKFITISGAVKNPGTFKIPLGTAISDCVELAGGATISDYAVLFGGAMMGELVTDASLPITKTTAGLIILPLEHQLVKRRLLPKKAVRTIGASACDQCYRCTELCPRWLLGYDIQPHEVMRSLLFAAGEREEHFNRYSILCIECNICSLYACPEDLDPKNICTWSKRELISRGLKVDKSRPVKAHPVRSGRQVPTPMLTRKLGLARYEEHAPFKKVDFHPERVRLPLKQHAGSAAVPVVNKGDTVSKGDIIAEIPNGMLGARIHASIDGIVEAVSESDIMLKRG